jgi:hypothetical protein
MRRDNIAMPERRALRNTLCCSCYSPRSTDSFRHLLALADSARDLTLYWGLFSVRISVSMSCPWFYSTTAALSLHNLVTDHAHFLLSPQSTVCKLRCSFHTRKVTNRLFINQPHLMEKMLLFQYEGGARFNSCHYKHKIKQLEVFTEKYVKARLLRRDDV